MDEFSDDDAASPKPGEAFDMKFSTLLDDDEPWEAIFAGNPDGRSGLEPLDGWRYRAYGKIIGISPVTVNCGLLVVEGVVASSDPRLIGEPVAFTITRLGACAYAT